MTVPGTFSTRRSANAESTGDRPPQAAEHPPADATNPIVYAVACSLDRPDGGQASTSA
jgi:hypothetical protein